MISEVKAGLDDIARDIRAKRAAVDSAKEALESVITDLDSIPTTYADAIAQIGELGTDPSDVVYKDELSKLTTEFVALRASANGAVAVL